MNRLKNCRFDEETNTINKQDFDYTIPTFNIKYSNDALTKRRQEEFQHFNLANANIPFDKEI